MLPISGCNPRRAPRLNQRKAVRLLGAFALLVSPLITRAQAPNVTCVASPSAGTNPADACQKITDLYALASDYSAESLQTREFFAAVQNKLHWAITGKTAAETIRDGADATKPAMGLATWKHAPHGKVLKSDVTVAKNYLNATHVAELNRIVSAYLDLAENRAQRGLVTTMADWATFLNRYLELADYPILADKGKVSALEAKLKAEAEYQVFRHYQDQDYVSDFDREIKRLEGRNNRKQRDERP